MSGRPEDDPLGATPVLPPPSGASATRARDAFRDYLDQARAAPPPEQETAVAASVPPASVPESDSFGGGRRYDLALSLLDEDAAAMPPMPEPVSAEVTDPGYAPTAVEEEPTAAGEVEAVAERPPPGAPMVRPPVQRPQIESVSQEMLESAADTAMLTSNPDGTASFDIVFNDELFENLACRISVTDGRVVATFRAQDENTRRLIEAEAGMLRVRFEERGLKVAEIRVQTE